MGEHDSNNYINTTTIPCAGGAASTRGCYTIRYCIIQLLYCTILYYTLLYETKLYSALLYSTLLDDTIIYYTIPYYTILH